MAVEPPFIYDAPSRYSFCDPTDRGFDPKVITRTSWAPSNSSPKPKGPLIDFTRQSNSKYAALPHENAKFQRMNPRIKLAVKYTRWVQLGLRVVELLATLILLFCVICVKNVSGTASWIIRVPVAVAVLHTVYATYHLLRSYKGRPPASSGSYHLFATVFDAGLIPFFVFTALMSKWELNASVDEDKRWEALFGDESTRKAVIRSLYLGNLSNGSLHLVSLILSIYLAIVFRKIARLPPDMNPLEDHLTSRRQQKKSHKADSKDTSESTACSNAPNRTSGTKEPLIPVSQAIAYSHVRTHSSSSADIGKLPDFASRPTTSYPESPSNWESEMTELAERLNTLRRPPYDDGDGSRPPSRDGYDPNLFFTQSPSTSHSASTMNDLDSPKTPGREVDETRAAILDDTWFAPARKTPTSFVNYSRLSQTPKTEPQTPVSLEQRRKGDRRTPEPASEDENNTPPESMSSPSSGQKPTRSPKRKSYGILEREGRMRRSAYTGPAMRGVKTEDRSGRVVSNSGAEVTPRGKLGKREVSGKILEEGRGGKGMAQQWDEWRNLHGM